MKEIQGRELIAGILLIRKTRFWRMHVLLFADGTVLVTEDKSGLQGLVTEV